MKEIVKIVVFVPETHADAVREVMGQVGTGKIGNYTFCSFSTKGIGRFLPGEEADPAIGFVGKMETVQEERIEAICEKAILPDVINAIKKAHPYEEVAFDIYSLLSQS